MEHYFSQRPSTPHRHKRIRCFFFGRSYSFLTDTSVFSSKKIDTGTRLLIESAKPKKKDMLLDLGCGYGVVGIVLSFFCRKVVMVDINERACKLSRTNIKENNVGNAEVICGSLEEVSGRFDMILFNPPIRAGKRVYLPLLEKSSELLFRGGSIHVVARTGQGAKSIFDFMDRFYDVEYAEKRAGYRVMVGTV